MDLNVFNFKLLIRFFIYYFLFDFQGHEYNNPAKKPQIFLKACFDELKPKGGT